MCKTKMQMNDDALQILEITNRLSIFNHKSMKNTNYRILTLFNEQFDHEYLHATIVGNEKIQFIDSLECTKTLLTYINWNASHRIYEIMRTNDIFRVLLEQINKFSKTIEYFINGKKRSIIGIEVCLLSRLIPRFISFAFNGETYNCDTFRLSKHVVKMFRKFHIRPINIGIPILSPIDILINEEIQHGRMFFYERLGLPHEYIRYDVNELIITDIDDETMIETKISCSHCRNALEIACALKHFDISEMVFGGTKRYENISLICFKCAMSIGAKPRLLCIANQTKNMYKHVVNNYVNL